MPAQQIQAQVTAEIRDLFQQIAGQGSTKGKNFATAPEKFDGTRSKYESFRRQLDLYLRPYIKDNEKIFAALTYFKGVQGEAFAARYQDENSADIESGKIKWDDFLKAADKHWRNEELQSNSVEDLLKARMFRSESAAEFFGRLDKLRRDAQLTDSKFDDMLVGQLQRNMPNPLVHEILMAFDIKKAGSATATLTYDTFKDLALQVDHRVKRYVMGINTRTNNQPWKRETNPFSNDTPMEIDRVSRDEARKKGLCFNCGEHGHIGKNCPKPKRRGQPSKTTKSTSGWKGKVRELIENAGDTKNKVRQMTQDLTFEEMQNLIANVYEKIEQAERVDQEVQNFQNNHDKEVNMDFGGH